MAFEGLTEKLSAAFKKPVSYTHLTSRRPRLPRRHFEVFLPPPGSSLPLNRRPSLRRARQDGLIHVLQTKRAIRSPLFLQLPRGSSRRSDVYKRQCIDQRKKQAVNECE